MQEPEEEGREHQDDANLGRQPLPEVAPEEQDVHPTTTAAIATTYSAPAAGLPTVPPSHKL